VIVSGLSPATIHLGLLERGGSKERFLRDSGRPMDVAYFGDDPNWTDDQLWAFVSGFDVVFSTEPPDLTLRTARNWTRGYRKRLVEKLAWRENAVGSLVVRRDPNEPIEVRVIACRRSL